MAVFIKTTIMGQVDEDLSTGSQELLVDIKKQLIATFGAVIYRPDAQRG